MNLKEKRYYIPMKLKKSIDVKLTVVSAFVKMMAALSIVPNDSCGIVEPILNFGALNWISTRGCHLAGINSGCVNSSSKLGLNAIKHLEHNVTISINLEKSNLEI